MQSKNMYLYTGIYLALCLIVACPAFGRQNIVIGEISVGYDFQERNYDDEDAEDAGAVVEEEEGERVEGEEVGQAPEVIIVEDTRGDRQRYFVRPRIRYSSQGVKDLVEFTYAPAFTYDDVSDESEVDHDLRLFAERNLNRNWLVNLNNAFYYGEDPVLDSTLRTAVIVPGQEEPVEEPEVGAAPEEQEGQDLTESFGRRRFWRNDLSLRTDYTYAQDSIIGAGYNFGMLRNIDDGGVDSGAYTEYDRHEGLLRLSYRWNANWRSEIEGRYVKGDFDEPRVLVVSPGEGEDDFEVDPVGEEVSDDLEEYYARLRADYEWSPRDILFGLYNYSNADYEAELREDSAIHEFSVGWDHDFNRQVHMTLSGGPSFVKFDSSPNTTDYNLYAGLIWDFLHSSLNVFGEKGFDYENFDGRRNGITDFWQVRADYTHQFTPRFNTVLSAGYRYNDRNQLPSIGTVVIVDDGTTTAEDLAEEIEGIDFEYSEDIYDAGLTFNYNFLRWYTLSASYRYYDRQSDVETDYDEHRVLITLSASKELFRW